MQLSATAGSFLGGWGIFDRRNGEFSSGVDTDTGFGKRLTTTPRLRALSNANAPTGLPTHTCQVFVQSLRTSQTVVPSTRAGQSVRTRGRLCRGTYRTA